jgi:hypothetical protein
MERIGELRWAPMPRRKLMVERNRKTMNLLDEVLERRMLLYALAAGAALAGASAAQATVIFTANRLELKTAFRQIETLDIDLNNDGKIDFIVTATTYSSVAYMGELNARGISSNGIAFVPRTSAVAFQKGSKIGNSAQFTDLVGLASGFGSGYGQFANTSDRYLGVRFRLHGDFYYGWIGFRRVVTGPFGEVKAKIQGWAYETVPNKAIVAGDKGPEDSNAGTLEPTSLQLLAMGHTGVADRQRRMAVQANS